MDWSSMHGRHWCMLRGSVASTEFHGSCVVHTPCPMQRCLVTKAYEVFRWMDEPHGSSSMMLDLFGVINRSLEVATRTRPPSTTRGRYTSVIRMFETAAQSRDTRPSNILLSRKAKGSRGASNAVPATCHGVCVRQRGCVRCLLRSIPRGSMAKPVSTLVDLENDPSPALSSSLACVALGKDQIFGSGE